jgi:hypothetical protein
LRKRGSKILKFGLYGLLGILTLSLLTMVLINLSPVQQWILGKVVDRAEQTLQTKVRIGHISWTFPNRVVLDEVHLWDQTDDSLIHIEKLTTTVRQLDLGTNRIAFGRTELVMPRVHFESDQGPAGMNYLFLTELGGEGGGGPAAHISFKKVLLKDGLFEYAMHDRPAPTGRAFNENHLRLERIQAEFLDLHIVGDSLDFKVKKLQTREHSGIELKKFVARTRIHYRGMEFDNLHLETPNSSLEHFISFSYNGYPNLSEFIDSVTIRSELDHSRISVRDLAYFSEDLVQHQKRSIDLEGSATGTVSDFKIDALALKSRSGDILKGQLRMKGVPNMQGTFIDLDIDHAASSIAQLEHFSGTDLGTTIGTLGALQFKGQLRGFLDNFAIEGDLRTDLGSLRSQLSMAEDSNAVQHWTGNVRSSAFNLGQLGGTDQMGIGAFDVTLDDIKGRSLQTLEGSIRAELPQLQLLDRDFADLSVEAMLLNGRAKTKLDSKDPKLLLTAEADLDLENLGSSYQIRSTVNRADLKALGLDSMTSVASGTFKLDFSGTNVDDLDGLLSVQDVVLLRSGQTFKLNNLFLSSGKDGSDRNILLRSDFADVNLKGNFAFSELDRVSLDFLHTLFPDYYDAPENMDEGLIITADARIRRNAFLGILLPVDLELGNGRFEGAYDASGRSLAVDGIMDRIVIQGVQLKDNFLNIRKKPYELLNMTADVASVVEGDSELVHRVEMNASILPNDVDFMLNFSDTADRAALRSFGHIRFGQDSISLELEQSRLYSFGQRWTIDDENEILFLNGETVVEYLTIRSGRTNAFLTGRVSGDRNDKLSIWLTNFQLSDLNPILAYQDMELAGFANGSFDLYQLSERPLVKANLTIDRIVYNGDTLGDFKISSTSGSHPLEMNIKASIVAGIFKNLELAGNIDWRKDTDNLDLQVKLREGSVKPFENIFKGLASNFSGKVDADVDVRGSLDELKLEGTVDLHQVGMTVDYLNSSFVLSNRVKLSERLIEFDNIAIQDSEGHTAKGSGSIKHDLFDNFMLDIQVTEAKSILAMNTGPEDNETFYGKAYGSGEVSFKGPLDDIVVNIQARSEKGTKIYIPVTSEGENTLVDYVSFTQPGQNIIRRGTRDIEGITMNMVFDITEDAAFELVFDELLDDKIYGRGKGSVKIEMNSYGDFFLFGDFEISEGYYPFASAMLVSERFILQKGGKIRWDGDPYNAYIDMEAAIRRNKANPYDLMLGSTFLGADDANRFRGDVVVDVQLFLRGELFNPDISFGIDLPNNASISGSSEFLSVLNRVRSDEDELNRQVFSLVTFGSFSPTNFSSYQSTQGDIAGNIGQTVNNSLSSFLSGQLNNWISQANINWEIGLDWQAQNAQQQAELVVSVRRKLFNDRLEVAGSVDAYSTVGRNPYDVNLVYNIRKDGKLRVKAFQKLANDPTLGAISNVTTTGFGFFFRTQFDRIRLCRKPQKEVSKAPY